MPAKSTHDVVDGIRGPIFVGGGERSGKTLIRFMLSALPNLTMTRRVNMWPNFYLRYGDLAREENFERCLDAMVHYKHVRFLQPDPERIRREFQQGPRTYARLFALFQEHHAEREGKPRWGDQTGYIERYADPIFAAYPTAKMIHMIRDPRDSFEASFSKSPHRRGRAGISTASWLLSTDLARRNLKKYPGRYQVVQFEKLVSQPEQTLRQVCDFIGEQFTPEMLTMKYVPRYQEQLGRKGDSGQSPLSTEYIGRYKNLTTKSGIVFIQKFSKREMHAWSYTLAPVKLPPREYLKFALITWPANFMSFITWRVLGSKTFDQQEQYSESARSRLAPHRSGKNPNRVI